MGIEGAEKGTQLIVFMNHTLRPRGRPRKHEK
jgi:hypothetical protein